MKTCNADATAKALKGDERKAFMSTCLKTGAPAGGKA
ncbi:PsiF family protein, partial [Pseudomonas aeruginosa]|nr:PsiF family protein [Pseudomonas aeruginosa]